MESHKTPPPSFEIVTGSRHGDKKTTTTAHPPSTVPLAPVRRIPSLLGSRSHPSRMGSLSSVKEEDDHVRAELDHDVEEEEITLSALQAERDTFDDESQWEDSMSEVSSVHTENPQFIAIGIVRSPSIQPSSDETSQVDGKQSNNEQEEISETVAKDIAKEEHDLKFQERMANNDLAWDENARRRPAPSVLSSRRASTEFQNQEYPGGRVVASAASQPSRAYFNKGSRTRGSGTIGPSKSFLLSLSEDELLPTVVEPVAPPVRTSSFSQSADEAVEDTDEDGSSNASPSINPKVRARKTHSGSGAATMSDAGPAAKMRTVRGALRVEPRTRQPHTCRSHSDASTSHPVVPSRNMPIELQCGSQAAQASDDEISVCPSLRTIHTMQSSRSSRSITSVSSGITLDEKTTERIAQSAPLRARRPTRTISDESNSHGASVTTAGSASVESDGERKPAAASDSIPSIYSACAASAARPSDDKRNMRISPSSLQSVASVGPPDANLRPSDEKAQYHRPDISSMHSRASASSQGVASFTSVSSEELQKETSSNGHPEMHEDLPFQTVMGSDSNDEETDDLEAQAGVPVLLPGAFAVGGSLDEDDEFDDTDSLVGSVAELVVVADDNPSRILTRGSISGSIESSTPLQAELYEEDSFVNAEILIEEEDAEDKILRRSFLARAVCIFLVVAAIAGIVIGVVLPRTAKKDNFNDSSDKEVGAPVLEGWNEVGKTLTGPTYKDNIRFGNSVALSGDGTRMAVGLPGADDTSPSSLKSTGAVKIYDVVNGTEWVEISQIVGLFANAESGSKVALSQDGSRVAIGAPAASSEQSGYVTVYQESNETGRWEQVGEAISGDINLGEVFGDSIGFSADGTVLAIGDKYSDRSSDGAEDTGLLRVYQEFNNTWIQKGLDLYGAEPGERFGWAIALSGDGNRVVATSLGTNESPGTVQAFDFDGILWNQVGPTLVGESPREAFGAAVALSENGSRLATGATSFSRGGQEAGVGIVRSFEFDEALQEWSLLGQPLEGRNPFDGYGSSVDFSSSGDILAIGGPENQNFCNNCGHIQVFQYGEDKWNRIGSELGKEDIDGGQYGYAVALSADGSRLAGAAPFTTFDGFVSKVGQVIVFDAEEEEASG
jgi:hypothetical protein